MPILTTEVVSVNYGRKIKEMITDSDYKQKQIAKELSITESMLSSYLTGRHDIPVYTKIVRMGYNMEAFS